LTYLRGPPELKLAPLDYAVLDYDDHMRRLTATLIISTQAMLAMACTTPTLACTAAAPTLAAAPL
jgi:hypothetical protein